MCNLLIPLCPFVLHSVTTSAQCGQQYRCPSDAKILFSYLSKNPDDSLQHGSRQGSSQIRTTPVAQKSTKLYKRTNWHTCSCFFHRVAVLHPMPGPSRPIFGMAYKPCKRCSDAAKTLRPMRMGGIGDKGDPFWNRCIFAGARGVFDNGYGDDDDGAGGSIRSSPLDVDTPRAARSSDTVRHDDSSHQMHGHAFPPWGHRIQSPSDSRRTALQHHKEDCADQRTQSGKDVPKTQYVMHTLDSANVSYSEGLDRYLADAYASKLRLRA